jgi:hypothetical protein
MTRWPGSIITPFLMAGMIVSASGCQIIGLAGEFIECGPDMCPGVYWVKEGGNRKQADMERDECWSIARNEVQPTGLVSHETMQQKIIPRQEACMKDRGYVITSNPPPGWVKKWGKEEALRP